MEQKYAKGLYFIIGILTISLIFVIFTGVRQHKVLECQDIHKLQSAYSYITNPHNGIASWDTEEEWNWNSEGIGFFSGVSGYSIYPEGEDISDAEELENLLFLAANIPWDYQGREELARRIAGIEVNWYWDAPYEAELVIESEDFEEISEELKSLYL